MHLLVDSCRTLTGESNPQPWVSRTMLYPADLFGQGEKVFFLQGRREVVPGEMAEEGSNSVPVVWL